MSKDMNELEDLVAKAFASLGEKAEKKEPKKQEPQEPLFDEKNDVSLEGQVKFSDVFGYEPPSGKDHVGKVFEDTDWPEYLRAYIPSKETFENYQPSKQKLEDFWIAYNMNDNVFASGPTGSGKSSFFEYWCAMIRQPFLRFNCREDMESSAIFGQLTARDGSTHWEDGMFTKGYQEGALFLFDEVSLMSSGITMGLQWALEDDGKLVLTDKPGSIDSKVVRPSPHTRICMADNTRGMGDHSGHFSGTGVMNTATLNRIHTFMHFNYLPVDQEVSILTAKYPSIKPNLAKKIISFASLVRTSYEQEEIDHTFSPRDLINLTRKALYLNSFSQALKMSWLDKFEDMDQQEAIKGHYLTVFNEEM